MNYLVLRAVSAILCLLTVSVNALVIPNAHGGIESGIDKRFPAIRACADKKEGAACQMQPNPLAMVRLRGSCQIDQVNIGGVQASALRCKPITQALPTVQATPVQQKAVALEKLQTLLPETQQVKTGAPAFRGLQQEPGLQIPAQTTTAQNTAT